MFLSVHLCKVIQGSGLALQAVSLFENSHSKFVA